MNFKVQSPLLERIHTSLPRSKFVKDYVCGQSGFTPFNMSTPVINKGITVLIIDCLFDLDRLFDCEI